MENLYNINNPEYETMINKLIENIEKAENDKKQRNGYMFD